MEARGGGPAQGDLAVLYELAEFFVDFLSVVISWCRSFAVRGGGGPQIPNGRFDASLPPLVHLALEYFSVCLLYTSPSPRDVEESRMPSSA